MIQPILNFFRGLSGLARMRAELDALTSDTEKRIDANAQKVAYLEGKLDGTLDAIHKLKR